MSIFFEIGVNVSFFIHMDDVQFPIKGHCHEDSWVASCLDGAAIKMGYNL
jgi:hypothetical protein